MAHQDGWIELYSAIESGKEYSSELVELCKSSRNGIGDMLHWYAIEGEPDVLQQLINLGFDINTQNDFGNTLTRSCSLIKINLKNIAKTRLLRQLETHLFLSCNLVS